MMDKLKSAWRAVREFCTPHNPVKANFELIKKQVGVTDTIVGTLLTLHQRINFLEARLETLESSRQHNHGPISH